MKKEFRRFLRYFFSGTLFIVPLVATSYFIFISISWLDSLLQLPYPGLGLLILIIVISLFGYLTTNFAFRTVIDYMEGLVGKIPLVKLLYTSIRDLIGAFVGDKRKFRSPVLITINKENSIYRVGFVTQEDLTELGLKDLVAVYMPHSYNFSGNFYLVARENIKPLDISGQAAMKFIVSGGVSGLDE